MADYLAARTLGEGSVTSFKQTMGDLLYYLSSQRSEACREAIGPFVEKYIQPGEIWNNVEDRTQVLSLAALLADFHSRTPVGSLVPDFRLPGVLRRKACLFSRSSRSGTFSLRSLKGNPAYVVFYSPDCSSCRETLAAVEALVQKDRKARVLLVDMDALFTDAPELAADLLDSFDLSVLPFVLQLAPDGTVLRRYVQLF